jgi:hypothetical protein
MTNTRRTGSVPPRPLPNDRPKGEKIFLPKAGESITVTVLHGPEEVASQVNGVEYRYRCHEGTLYATEALAAVIDEVAPRMGETIVIERTKGNGWVCDPVDQPTERRVTQRDQVNRQIERPSGEVAPLSAPADERMRWAMQASVDLWAETLAYAAKKGMQIAPNAGDIRATANTLAIDLQKGGSR